MAKRLLQAGVLGAVPALVSGCTLFLVGAGAGGGVGTYAYVKGELSREYQANLDRTWAATLQALKALELKVAETSKDELGGTIEARRADGEKIRVTLEPKGTASTLVKIRIGTFGDREASERIGNQIAKQL